MEALKADLASRLRNLSEEEAVAVVQEERDSVVQYLAQRGLSSESVQKATARDLFYVFQAFQMLEERRDRQSCFKTSCQLFNRIEDEALSRAARQLFCRHAMRAARSSQEARDIMRDLLEAGFSMQEVLAAIHEENKDIHRSVEREVAEMAIRHSQFYDGLYLLILQNLRSWEEETDKAKRENVKKMVYRILGKDGERALEEAERGDVEETAKRYVARLALSNHSLGDVVPKR